MQIMDQFSHDLTIALEETSRMGGVRVGRWGQRRRTRSTGNLPCAPQPTEDSSSSPTDAANGAHNRANVDGLDGLNNSIHSDSDDRQEMRLAINPRLHAGNLESDSLNENFSPARFFRPSTRRKRKFKRMAVEYETTAKTPTVSGGLHTGSIENNSEFALTGTVKKRALRHAIQDSYRANLFFCGKRKRSHRDRCHDHEHGKAHSSSVPRQSHIFPVKHSLQEHKTRTRSFSSTSKISCDRILPLNKGLISKIEKISQQQQKNQQDLHVTPPKCAFLFTPVSPVSTTTTPITPCAIVARKPETTSFDSFASITAAAAVTTGSALNCNGLTNRFMQQTIPEHYALKQQLITTVRKDLNNETVVTSSAVPVPGACGLSFSERKKKYYRLRREQMKMQLQFEDPNSMECGELNGFLSSSSLSSSESENERTNDSDREGDDELTDWPGNEVVNNFDIKNDFKRKLTKKSGNLQQNRSDENATIGDDDTLMSADELDTPVNSVHRHMISAPIAINKGMQLNGGSGGGGGVGNLLSQKSFTLRDETMDQFRFPIRQIESEMSGETSNPFLASPPCKPGDIREIRAGCRRIKGERAAFSIKTSVNERLARFLQDARQSHIRLPDIEFYEHESLMNLAKLYSLQMSVDNGCAVLTKTSNTTQSVQIDHHGLQNCLFLSDFKRRCYDGRFGITDADDDNSITDPSLKFAKGGPTPPPEINNRLPNS